MKPLLNLLMAMVGITSLPVITGTFAGSKLGYDVFKTIDSMFEPSMSEEKTGDPKVDNKEEFDKTIITVELPGVQKENITISAYVKPIVIFGIPVMTASQSTLSLNKTELYVTAKLIYDMSYETMITVDNVGTADNIKASYDNGLLTIIAEKPGIVNIPIL